MLTLPSALDRCSRLFGARPAMVAEDLTCTWAEFLVRVSRIAGLLSALGVKRGERFAILARNTVRHYELLHAGYWLGAIPVPVNFRLAPPEIEFILDDAGCKVLFAEAMFRNLAAARNPIVIDDPGYEAAVAKASPPPLNQAREDDDAILLYTGGTTGRSKGVRLTHKNVISNGMQCAVAMQMRCDDIYLHVAPMFHSADLLGTGYTLLGAAHAFLPQFSPKALLAEMQRARVTVLMASPTVIIVTLQEPEFDQYDLTCFKRLFYGSAPMAVEWIRRAMERFPDAVLQQGYGLTETSPILTTCDPDQHAAALKSGTYDRLRSVGRPLMGLDLKLVDDNDTEVPRGEVGELAVRGPNVTTGYLNRPEETAKAIRQGWFHTGDLARMDEDGFVYLVDRKKDMIITGGENVYCTEVEAAVYQHQAVHEAAVIGVPDARYGEALLAVIVCTQGKTLTADELVVHCRGRIGGYKIPRRVALVKEMPKSAMGKILKTELRKMFATATPAAPVDIASESSTREKVDSR